MKDFFLSYAIPDKNKARSLAQLLTARGAKVAFDERDIQGGDDWVQATQNLSSFVFALWKALEKL